MLFTWNNAKAQNDFFLSKNLSCHPQWEPKDGGAFQAKQAKTRMKWTNTALLLLPASFKFPLPVRVFLLDEVEEDHVAEEGSLFMHMDWVNVTVTVGHMQRHSGATHSAHQSHSRTNADDGRHDTEHPGLENQREGLRMSLSIAGSRSDSTSNPVPLPFRAPWRWSGFHRLWKGICSSVQQRLWNIERVWWGRKEESDRRQLDPGRTHWHIDKVWLHNTLQVIE